MKKQKNKKCYSKKICAFCISLFVLVMLASFAATFFGFMTEVFIYLIPSTAAIAAAAVAFYYNKAKVENLSKQKLRNIVLKLALEKKINAQDYDEIIEEIENIDEAVDIKLNSLYEDALNEDVNIQI